MIIYSTDVKLSSPFRIDYVSLRCDVNFPRSLIKRIRYQLLRHVMVACFQDSRSVCVCKTGCVRALQRSHVLCVGACVYIRTFTSVKVTSPRNGDVRVRSTSCVIDILGKYIFAAAVMLNQLHGAIVLSLRLCVSIYHLAYLSIQLRLHPGDDACLISCAAPFYVYVVVKLVRLIDFIIFCFIFIFV